MRLFSVLTPVLALAACATAPAEQSLRDGATRCDGAALARFQGQAATQQLGADMLAATGATELRWVPYGTAVPMIYMAGRVTVFLDEKNNVRNASCS